jgi:hypothetical protein
VIRAEHTFGQNLPRTHNESACADAKASAHMKRSPTSPSPGGKLTFLYRAKTLDTYVT